VAYNIVLVWFFLTCNWSKINFGFFSLIIIKVFYHYYLFLVIW